MNIDQPLQDMIKANPSGKRRARSAADRKRSSATQKAAAAPAAKAPKARATGGKAPLQFPPKGPAVGSKIILSNLPADVTEAQVKELFTSLGPVRKVAMSYRQNGQSTGTCTVIFARAEDGQKAYQQYNNRLIDGKRPLKIEVIVDPSRLQPPPAAPASKPATKKTAHAKPAQQPKKTKAARATRPKKTLEDLDAEMEDYAKAGTTDTAPAA